MGGQGHLIYQGQMWKLPRLQFGEMPLGGLEDGFEREILEAGRPGGGWLQEQ